MAIRANDGISNYCAFLYSRSGTNRVLSSENCSFHRRFVLDDNATSALASYLNSNKPHERVHVGFVVFRKISDIAPVALGNMSHERAGLLEQLGKKLLTEIEFSLIRNLRISFRFQYVYAGVYCIGKYF